MPIIDPADLPSPPFLKDNNQYQYFLTLTQTLQNFCNQTETLCNTQLLCFYAMDLKQQVVSGTASLAVTFTQPLPTMVSYSVIFTPTWNTTWWLTNVTTASFILHFGTAPVVTSTGDIVVYLNTPLGQNT